MRGNRGLIAYTIIVLQLILFLYLKNFRIDSCFSTEPSVFLLLSSIVLSINLVYYKPIIVLNRLDKLGLLFVLFLVIKSFIQNNIEATKISYLVLLSLLYLCFKKAILNFTTNRKNYIYIFLLSLLLFIIFTIYHCCIQKENIDNFYLPNKSILSVVIASQICFLLPYYKLQFTSNRIIKYVSVVIVLGSVALLIATNSRSAWLGLLVALCFVFCMNVKSEKNKKYIKIASVIGFVFLLFVLFFYKLNSSSGRLLIYKISSQILKDNWLWGVGTGNFKVQYNNYQAQYFSTHSIDSKEALLADNTYYAFNDYYQLIIENGITAVLFLIFFGLLLYKQIKKVAKSDNPFAKASASAIICMLVAALFSYPLQFLPLTILLIFCLAIINSNDQAKTVIKANEIVSIGFVVVSMFCLMHYIFYYKYQSQAKVASNLSQTGFKTKSLQKYAELNVYYFNDGNVLYEYAKELFYTNHLKEAKEAIDLAKEKFTSHEVIKLSASINLELQNYKEAEKEYKYAINMVPNRMVSRKDLLDFYMLQKDTTNAIKWAKSIINMPIKIPSKITEQTIVQTKKILAEIQ